MSELATKEEWVTQISQSEMPVFGVTAGKLSSLAKDENSSAVELARVVLSDPTMTAKVLQIANTAYYNPVGQSIKTISRAIVLLGFQKIHAICLSVSIIDTLLRGKVRGRLMKVVATSFHAAIQAKSLVSLMGESQDKEEEVFIASLLFHLGQMVFWCFGNEQADMLDQQLEASVDKPADLEKKLLGFNLKEFTLALAQEWNLGDTLIEVVEGNNPNMPSWMTCIESGHTLASSLEQGWDSEDVEKTIKQLAKQLSMQPNHLEKLLQNNAQEAIRQAKAYKLPQAEDFIPVEGEVIEEEYEEIEDIVCIEPDEKLQLEVLRELSSLVHAKPDINLVLQLVLEGLHRGVGLDRVMVALLTPDRKVIKGKFLLSSHQTPLKEDFSFSISARTGHVFAKCMATKTQTWVGKPNNDEFNPLLTNELTEVLKTKNFFIAPITIKDKIIGLFYADRQPSKRDLDEESFKSYQHFCREACIALAAMGANK